MARIELNHRGMEEMLKSAATGAAMRAIAQPIAATAKATAPVQSGEYRDSIHVEPHTTDRAGMRVVAGTDHAAEVEAKTGNLARAAGAAGRP